MTECALCEALSAGGVIEERHEVCPEPASRLEAFGPGEGHDSNCRLRRCPGCGAWYQYRYHYELDMGGSWDEYYLWRLPEAARALTPVLADATPAEARSAALAALLEDPATTAGAALAGWIVAGRGHDVPVEHLAAILEHRDALASNYGYRALLTFLGHGPDRAVRVAAAVADRDGTAARILRKEARSPSVA